MESFIIVILEYLCHKRRLIWYGGGMHNHVPLSSFITYHLIFNMSKTMRATIGGSTIWPLAEAPPVFTGVRVAQSLVFSVVLCGPSLSFWPLSVWALYCLFFDLRLLILFMYLQTLMLFDISAVETSIFIKYVSSCNNNPLTLQSI